MKKKLAAMILTLALAAGVMAPVPAYADGITVEENFHGHSNGEGV